MGKTHLGKRRIDGQKMGKNKCRSSTSSEKGVSKVRVGGLCIQGVLDELKGRSSYFLILDEPTPYKIIFFT